MPAKYSQVLPFLTRPKVLHAALEKARENVFNRMPIRLLAFNANGTDISLAERPAIWRHISAQIECDFNNSITAGSAEADSVWELVHKHSRYAILSHTWSQSSSGEVTYFDWNAQSFNRNDTGYLKLENFCRVAATEYGLTFGWMDTVCINKESSAELDESIRSMYNWYQAAEVCIAHLGDTPSLPEMHTDTWFTRGWTLQELIAPYRLKFYSANWNKISQNASDDRNHEQVLRQIYEATTIIKSDLRHKLWEIPVSRRMQWAAHRRVTREEDAAYCLMGIFGVSFSTAYGEGAERAFIRLMREVLATSGLDMFDIMNWGYGPNFPAPKPYASILIPWSPKLYLWRARGAIQWYRSTTPITLTHLGLCTQVLLMPATREVVSSSHASATFDPQGGYSATAEIDSIFPDNTSVKYTYKILDRQIFRQGEVESAAKKNSIVKTLGVLNIVNSPTAVKLPENGICYAVLLDVHPPPISGSFADEFRLPTMYGISFELTYHGQSSFVIPKEQLQHHGMTLRTLYL